MGTARVYRRRARARDSVQTRSATGFPCGDHRATGVRAPAAPIPTRISFGCSVASQIWSRSSLGSRPKPLPPPPPPPPPCARVSGSAVVMAWAL